ncbi:DUF3575 domain-containing protein [Riemerella columbipharyngis]|nr:DUF3575 domain-containing protein [Riemerella columbipharyngis]
MKTAKIILFLFLPIAIFAQNNVERKFPEIYVKGNVLTLPALIFNAGAECKLAPKYTLQADVLVSPWRSVNGHHFQIYMGHTEVRYYFKQAFKGWYAGLNVGFGLFDITKWNYLKSKKYQRGFNYMLGGVVGYQYQWSKKWNIDLFLGGGSSQGFYHGYEPADNPPSFIRRYEVHSGKWNLSGEWIPYRGGIMLSYKLN